MAGEITSSLAEDELKMYWRASSEIRALLATQHGSVIEMEELKDAIEDIRDLSDWPELKVLCMSAVVELSAKIADIKDRVRPPISLAKTGRPTA